MVVFTTTNKSDGIGDIRGKISESASYDEKRYWKWKLLLALWKANDEENERVRSRGFLSMLFNFFFPSSESTARTVEALSLWRELSPSFNQLAYKTAPPPRFQQHNAKPGYCP